MNASVSDARGIITNLYISATIITYDAIAPDQRTFIADPCTRSIIRTNGPEVRDKYVPSIAKVRKVIKPIFFTFGRDNIVNIKYIFIMSITKRRILSKATPPSVGDLPNGKIPLRYVPLSLSRKDLQKQRKGLIASRRAYKRQTNREYIPRPHVASFRSKPSKHVANAQRIYGVSSITPSRTLARKTGCSMSALKQIVKKGEGAYYSSGSRPNQTAHSWAYARLASSITGGNAAKVDMHILEKGCKKSGKAYKMAVTDIMANN